MAKKLKQVDTTENPVDTNRLEEKDGLEQYLMMIAEAAYYKAESRGFEPGHEIEDWIEAEQEIMNAQEKNQAP